MNRRGFIGTCIALLTGATAVKATPARSAQPWALVEFDRQQTLTMLPNGALTRTWIGKLRLEGEVPVEATSEFMRYWAPLLEKGWKRGPSEFVIDASGNRIDWKIVDERVELLAPGATLAGDEWEG